MEWGRGLEGRKERGKRRDYAPSFLFNLSSLSLLQKLKSPVLWQSMPSSPLLIPPTFCRMGREGGDAAVKGHLRQMGRYTPESGWVGGWGSRGGKSFTLSEHSELLRGRVG